MKKLSNMLRPNCMEESSEEYFERVFQQLPNFPPEVVSQWLFHHFDSVMHRYSWLDFHSLAFTLRTWSTGDILAKVTAWNETAVESWKKALLTNQSFQSSRLGRYMISEGTWPVPPIIFNNTTGIKMPDGSEIAEWELIEGHHRLAYLRALNISDEWDVSTEHTLWILTIV